MGLESVVTAWEGKAVGDLQPGVRHQTQQSSLGNATATGAGLQLVAMLYQLHDHQTVYLDNLATLRLEKCSILSQTLPYLDTGVILRVLTGVSARVRHLLAINQSSSE